MDLDENVYAVAQAIHGPHRQPLAGNPAAKVIA